MFDAGTPAGAIALDRAIGLASRIILVETHQSPNADHNRSADDDAGIAVVVERPERNQGIRHALARCPTTRC